MASLTKPETGGTKIVVQHGQSSAARTIRETIESIVIAFILAFLFRTFEAEAFVIPTGSMAPTLQGRHKDIECPKCGYHYRVSASQEVDENGNQRGTCHVVSGTCPMCRYKLDVDGEDGKDYPSYNGDRIIVSKFAYDLEDPHRWDVVVFKYPEDAKTNYIKRLVGLPNERIKILYGDIYTAPLGSGEFNIARKPPEKVRHMLQPVYDNDYVVPELIEAGMPQRWQSWDVAPTSAAWKPSADYKSFEATSQSGPPSWLRYQNIVPDQRVWSEVGSSKRISPPQPSLIGDFYAYNAGQLSCDPGFRDDSHWVGDLAVDCELTLTNNKGSVILELEKGGRQFRCTLNSATGEATLGISGKPDFAPTANTAIRGPGTYQVSFANIDEQLLLWIGGKSIEFNSPTTYDHLHNLQPVQIPPTPGSERPTDLSPVGIAIADGASASISHLQIARDVYYTADPGTNAGPFIEAKDQSKALDLKGGEYFMLGDNSPQSKDGRYWTIQNFVDRKLLIGKALFVYWPHSFNYVEIGSKKITLPFWPNFGRMRFVH
jgi:signal peptidase I